LKIISIVNFETVAEHLNANGSALSLPLNPDGYEMFHVGMDQGDERRIVLWWENEKATKDQNCRLVDSNDSAGDPKRVNSFICGNAKGHQPTDLSTVANLELVAVTDNLHSDFWFLIDGSHRSIAQFRSQKSFQDVRIYVCVHSQIMQWPCIPNYYKPKTP